MLILSNLTVHALQVSSTASSTAAKSEAKRALAEKALACEHWKAIKLGTPSCKHVCFFFGGGPVGLHEILVNHNI